MKKLFIVFLPAIMLINGCATNRTFLEKIHKNAVLREDEKAFAVRYYTFVNSNKIQENSYADIENIPEIYKTKLYDKWSLGDYKNLSIDEKKYLMYLLKAIELREIYYSVDLNNLTQKEQSFLKETHDQYGDKVIFTGEEIYEILMVISGLNYLDDKSLIILHRYFE